MQKRSIFWTAMIVAVLGDVVVGVAMRAIVGLSPLTLSLSAAKAVLFIALGVMFVDAVVMFTTIPYAIQPRAPPTLTGG